MLGAKTILELCPSVACLLQALPFFGTLHADVHRGPILTLTQDHLHEGQPCYASTAQSPGQWCLIQAIPWLCKASFVWYNSGCSHCLAVGGVLIAWQALMPPWASLARPPTTCMFQSWRHLCNHRKTFQQASQSTVAEGKGHYPLGGHAER